LTFHLRLPPGDPHKTPFQAHVLLLDLLYARHILIQPVKRSSPRFNETYLAASKYTNSPHIMKKLKVLLGMLVAFLPILVLGTIGTVLDGGTLLGGMLITLGYVLSILITGIMLKRQGSSWRDIGLVRPKSWLRTIVLVIGTVIALIAISLAILNIAQLIPGATGINVS